MKENQVAKFTVEIPQDAKGLAKFVMTGSELMYYPHMQYIALLPDDEFITATDKHVLSVYKSKFEGEWPKNENFSVYIDPKHFVNMVGSTVEVNVFKDEIEVEETVVVKRTSKKVKVKKAAYKVQVLQGDKEYITTARKLAYPPVRRVLPKREDYEKMEFTPESFAQLKQILKMTSKDDKIVIKYARGKRDVKIVHIIDGVINGYQCFNLMLTEPSKSTEHYTYNAKLLNIALGQCDGGICFCEDKNRCSPTLISDKAYATIIMSINLPEEDALRLEEVELADTNTCVTGSEMLDMRTQIQNYIKSYWNEILRLNAFNMSEAQYSAKDLATKKFHFSTPDMDIVEFKSDNIKLSIGNYYKYVFGLWAMWEKLGKDKLTFDTTKPFDAETLDAPQSEAVADNNVEETQSETVSEPEPSQAEPEVADEVSNSEVGRNFFFFFR